MYIAISWYILSHTIWFQIYTKKTNNVVYLPVSPSPPRMTFRGTVQLSHDSSTVVSTAELQRKKWLHAECYKAQCSKPCSCMYWLYHTLTGVDSLDVRRSHGGHLVGAHSTAERPSQTQCSVWLWSGEEEAGRAPACGTSHGPCQPRSTGVGGLGQEASTCEVHRECTVQSMYYAVHSVCTM